MLLSFGIHHPSKIQMIILKMISSKIIIALIALLVVIGAQSCPQLCTTNCTNGTCSSCRTDFNFDAAITTSCSCPVSMFLNTTSGVCLPCPITCLACTSTSNCTTCIPGFMISNQLTCITGAQNANGWVSKNISYDFTSTQPSGSNFVITVNNTQATQNMTAMGNSCSKMPTFTWLGGYITYPYTAKVMKSIFSLPPHQWINIRFQAVIIDRWFGNTLLLEMNTYESYNQTVMESPQIIWNGTYVSGQRFLDFCGNSSYPDNLAVVDKYIPHNASSIKLRIRLLESDYPFNATSNLNELYYGIREIYVRVGTCGKNCRYCSGPSLCTECVLPYTLSNGSCICNSTFGFATSTGCQANCLVGYYYNTTAKSCLSCENLVSNCQNCTNSGCSACSIGYFLFSSATVTLCTRYCPNGFTQTRNVSSIVSNLTVLRDQCTVCPSNCSTCSFNFCLFCMPGFAYYQGNCVLSCPQNTFLNQGSCQSCSPNCLSCTNNITCTTCASGYGLANNLCTPYCLNSTILSVGNSSAKVCNATCFSGCLNCFGPALNQCLSCSSSLVLQAGQCVSNCSVGYYQSNNSCLPCPSQCASCINAIYCTSCSSGFFLNFIFCNRMCQSAYYPLIVSSNSTNSTNSTNSSQIQCAACPTGCQRCKNSNFCQECTSDYFLFNFTCAKNNPMSFYFDFSFGKFKPCQSNCLQCNELVCFKCSAGYFLNQGVCVLNCGPDKFPFMRSFYNDTTLYGFCEWKSPQCQEYDNVTMNGTCNKCSYFQPNLFSVSSSIGCKYSCPTFYVESASGCLACPQNCRRCTMDMKCLECLYNYVINSIDLITTSNAMNQSCVPNYCPQPYFSDSVQCQKCPPGCQDCEIDGRCLTCLPGYQLSYEYSVCYANNCSSTQFYSNTTASLCQSCISPCISCISSNVCTSCISLSGSQLYLLDGSCLQSCPTAYFAHYSSGFCRKCHPKCATCSNFYNCLTCTPQFYLLSFYDQDEAQCVSECPVGFWSDTAVCQLCYQDCQSCYGPSEYQCLSCYPNFYLDDSKCVWECSVSKYADYEGYCDWCDPSCLQCNGPTVQNCISCADNYFFYAHTCSINECPDGTFLSFPELRLCDACQFGCSTCESPQFCRFCFPGYSLYRGWCYKTCPFSMVSVTYRFPYLNLMQGYICSSCLVSYSNNCIECDGSTCTRCNTGYFLYRNSLAIVNVTLKEQCVTNCPLGTYIKSNEEGECVSCQTNCLSCTSYQNCQSCATGYNLINGYCTNNCPSGTYLTVNLNCSSCPTICPSCSSNISCTSCISGYYLFINSTSLYRTCIQTCPTGYFADASSGWCKKCLSTCTACTATTTCTQCYANFTLSNGLCINQTSNNCTANCQLCSAQSCLKCTPPYLLSTTDNSSTCVSMCPNGTYSNVFTCDACNSSCVTCQYTANNCYQCQTGLYLLGQTCVNVCPVGYFASTALQTCQSCSANCLNCQQSTCYTCVSGYYLYYGYCFPTCPAKTFASLSTGQCFNCPTGCNYCTNSSNCTTCSSTYMLYNGVCTLICPQTTYNGVSAQGYQACLPCPNPCYACTNTSCVSCLPGYILNGTICQITCNSGYFISTTITNYDNEDPSYNFSTYSQCKSCDSSCTTCVTSSTTCLSCNPPYILYGTQCLSSCPMGTFINQTICSPCSAYCVACIDSVTCTVCINCTALFSNQCFATCPTGYFMKLQTNSTLSPYICQTCSSACQTCTGPSQYQCITCNSQYYSNGNGSCLSTCPRGTYADTLLQLCSPCPYSCSSCTSQSNCSSCISNFTLTSTNQCRQTSTCNASNCQYCLANSTAQCAQCLPNFYLVNATCITQCPSNTYPSCNKCVSCSSGCVSCNVQGCFTCSNTTLLYQGKCYTTCPAGTYNVSNVCQSNPCLAYSSVNNDCLSCASPYLLSNISTISNNNTTYRMGCVLTCAVGFVKAGSSCVPCPNACASCISTSICTNCTASAMLYQGSCFYICPIGTYPLSSACQKCSLPYCTQCVLIGGVQACTDCEDSSGTFLVSGTCVITCPSGTYAATGSLACNNCSNNCNQCTGLNSCTVCASGFYLYLGQCLTICPSGTSTSGNICIICSTGCSQCISLTNCSLCQSSYSLSFTSNGSSCVTTCQPGFYSKSVISTSYSNSNQYQCVSCVSPCLTCTSATSCTQCVSNTSLYLTTCVQSCPQGTYSTITQTIIVSSASNSASVCNPCSTACLTCASTASYCMSCPSGYLLDNNNNCVSNCNAATSYYSQTTRQCYSCSQQCYSCYGPGSDNCLSCRPVLQLFAGSCFSACPFGYYATSAYICQSCSTSCVTCLGTSTNCTLCNTNLYLQVVNSTGTCVSSCNVGLYINYTSLSCMVCDSTCAACVGISTQCINCPSGFLLYNYRCLASCPAGTTPTFTNSQYHCTACQSNCASCIFNTSSSRIACTVCSSGYYLVNGNCSQTCPAGTYSSPSTYTCVTCLLTGCQTCALNSSLLISCSACQTGYFIYNGACFTSCPTGTVSSGVQCVLQPTCQGYQFLEFCFNVCPAATYATNITVTTSGVVTFTLGCNNCSSFCSNCLSASLCIQCFSSTYLYTTTINGTLQSTCVNACPSGFYSALSVCLACASPCLTCQQTTTGISCLTCQSGFYLLGSVCYTTCPVGYYVNGIACSQCSSVCSACNGSSTNCTLCKNVLTLAPNCASSVNCTSNQYLSGNSTCSACSSACLTCYGGSSYECSSCANSSNVLINGICVTSCASGTVHYQSTCVSCPTNCLTCNVSNNTFTCTSCASPYILAGSSGCVLSCSALNTATTSYLLINGNCQLCNISGCLICSTTSNSSLQCTTCNNASFLYNQACYSICPTGTMATYNPNACVSCPQNCLSCSSASCFKCATGLMLLNGACVTNCGSGYYNINGTCTQCSVSNCISCSTSGCLACQQPFVLANGTCSGCINGYYNNNGACSMCNSPCLTCVGSSTICTSCTSSYFLTNNTCVTSCPTGFYVSSSATCVACTVSNCQTCTNTGCSSCMTGYYSYFQSNQTTCVSTCPSGTYSVPNFPTCNTCSPLCATCTSSSSCLTCQSPAVLSQGFCISTCPSGSININQTCVSCLSGCKVCTALANCTSCNTGLVANANGACTAPISNCSTGYYLNSLKNCSQCFSTCKTCSGGGSFDCLSCFTGYLLVNGVCTQSCNSDSFYSNSTNSCQLCTTMIANCVSCTSTSCLSCATNYTVSNGSCTRSCPSSTYLSNGVCNSCPNYCMTCSSSTSCSQCLNSTFILMNGLCYSSCPDQTFLSNNTCMSCYQTCLTCASSSTNCSSCITPYNLYGSSCYATCPNSTFSSNYTCQNCSSNCLLCSDINTCTLCSSSFYLMNGTCRSTCLSGYYVDTTSNRCIQCPSPCLVCTSRTNCTSCQSPSTLNNGMCISSNCSAGYYNYTLNICVNCTINHCAYCTNSSCSYCASSYYSIYQNGILTYCEPGCLSGTYPDNSTMNCSSCFTNCFSCVSTTWCNICKAGYYLLAVQNANANECVTSCPAGYYINNATLSCSSCSSNCEACTSANICQDCGNNYYLFMTNSSTTCVSNCPTSYFNPTVLDGSGSCGSCATNCYSCNDVQTCTQCISSTYVIINGVCTPSNCVNCLLCNFDANICITCITGYYLFNSVCLATCPDNYYADNTTQTCQTCTTNCLLCTQSTNCLLCISGYVFVNGTGCQNEGQLKFGLLGNMSGFTSNITKIMSIVYVSTSAGPIAFGAIGSTYGPMQFCQFMYLLQGSTGGNQEVSNFLNSMSSVSYTTNSGTGTSTSQTTGNSTASTARLLTAISYTSSFLQTNYPVFLIMLAFISSYILVLILEKYNQSCCLSCPTLLKYVSYTCDFMKKRFKFIYVDCILWISYLPFLYFAILQLQIGKFDSGMNIFSSLLAIVIIIVYPLYPVFILRKLFDRSDNPVENLVNYKAITLKEPLRVDEEKPLCADFTCCPKEDPNMAMVEMSLSPYIEKVVRPIYNEHDPDYNEFRYFTIPHFRLAYSAIKYFRKFIYVLIVALCPDPVTTLALLVTVTALYIVYLIALKPKEKLYLVLEIILELVLLFFITFMLVYVIVGGANVSYLSIVTHAIGFIIANSTLAVAIILNIMSYYTIFCCIVDLLKHIRNKKIEEDNPIIPDEKQFQIENIHNPDDVDGTGQFTLQKELKGKFNDKEDMELRKSIKKGDDEMTVENNEDEQYVPYDLDEKQFNVRSSMVNKKKKTFDDELPEEDFANLKSTKNPKAKRDRRAERKKSSHHLEEESNTSEEIMGQSKVSTEEVSINDGLLKDKNSKYKRQVNKNDVNVNRGELREPTNNFRRNKNLKDANPSEQESMDTLMRPEVGKKRSKFNEPFDEFAVEIDTHERMVPLGKFDDVDPKFAERQARRKDKKDDNLNPIDEPYMRERQGNSKNSKPNDLNQGNMYDRQGRLRQKKSGKEPQGSNLYERENKKRINNNFNDNSLEEATGKDRIKKAKEGSPNANNNDMFEVIGKERNKMEKNILFDFDDDNKANELTGKERSKERVGEANMYDRQGKLKNQKDASKERDMENANMVEKNKKRQDNLFGQFEEIFEETKPGVKDANMKERQRQKKEKSLNEENLVSGFVVEPNTVERKPQGKKLQNLHYKGSSDEEGVIKEGQVVEAQNKFKRNIRQKPSDNVPESDINAYGKDIRTKKVEKIASTKEFAEDTPQEVRYKERQAKEINKARSYNERAESQDVEEVSAYNREKKVMDKKKKETEQKIEDANLLSVNPKMQQKQKSKKPNIYDDLDNELAESVEFKIQKPKQKRSNEPEEDFEQSEMGKNIKTKQAKMNRRADRKLEVSENIEESYDDIVKRNKESIFKQNQGGKSRNLLEIEDDFEVEDYSRPASKIVRPSSRSKDGGLGINSRGEESSDNESSTRKLRASAIQRQRNKGSMKVNDNELNVDENQVAADQRKKSKIVAPKSNRIRGVLNIDDKSDDENLEQLKF